MSGRGGDGATVVASLARSMFAVVRVHVQDVRDGTDGPRIAAQRRMRSRSFFTKGLVIAFTSLCACAVSDSADEVASERRIADRTDAITSIEAEILDFTFDTEVLADDSVSTRRSIVRQLLYAQGILRLKSDASGQVGNVELSNVTESRSGTDGEKKLVRYRAKLPVAWPKKNPPPSSYELQLPRDATTLARFNQKYDGYCGRSEHGQENFWHDWDPRWRDCRVDIGDVVRVRATIGPHEKTNEVKYPEYDRIWDDGRLDVVAIFGVIESNDADDWGYTEAQRFVQWASDQLTDVDVTPRRAGRSILADTTVIGKATVGGQVRDVKIDVFVVGMIAQAGRDFDQRYDPLSERADLILYNGHAQLGANTNALARKGNVVPNKYQLVVLNGCESFALVDTAMVDRRRDANGADDPDGTRFLDVITNAKPGYANNLANMSYLVYKAALLADTPVSFTRLIGKMPESHVVVVWGEEDNKFKPAYSFRHHPAVFAEQSLVFGP